MLIEWWNNHIKYQDPGYSRLYYSLRVLITMVITAFITQYFSIEGSLWAIIAAFFTTLSQTDINYRSQLKQIFICGILCLVGIIIGSILGISSILTGIGFFILGALVYKSIRSPFKFTALVMPLFAFVIATAYPTSYTDAVNRIEPTSIGILIAWLTGIFLFPCRAEKILIAIEKCLSHYYIDCFNFIFLSYLTGNKRMQSAQDTFDKVFDMLHKLNQQLIYLNNPQYDIRAKHYFNLFSQAYFLGRLFNEPTNPDQLLYLKDTIEEMRLLIKNLLIAWDTNNTENIELYAKKITDNCISHENTEAIIISDTIKKVTTSIKALTCNTP